MKNTKIGVMILHPDAKVPVVAKPGDAGADLRALKAGVVPARSRAFVGTGIAIELEPGTVGLVHPRSGLARNKGITVLNAPGTIDSGYRGEVQVILLNTTDEDFEYKAGERIAQLVVQEYLEPECTVVASITETVRGAGGFGHSGTE